MSEIPSVVFSYPTSAKVTIRMSPSVITTLTYDGGIIEFKAKDGIFGFSKQLWQWDSFHVVRKIRNPEAPNLGRYDFELNGHLYFNKSIPEFREEVLGNMVVINGKQIFHRCIEDYCKTYSSYIPEIALASAMGFMPTGWQLPDHFIVDYSTGILNDFQTKLTQMLTTDTLAAKAHFKAFYDACHIDYKDIVFAWFLIAPFTHALKGKLGLQPWCAVGSAESGTGKTLIGKTFTSTLFGGMDIINKDVANHESQLYETLATSTFPLVLDDVGEMNDRPKEVIKSYATSNQKFTRKNTDQSLRINRSQTAALFFTFNTFPAMFQDPAFLSRGIFIPITTKMTPQDATLFQTAIDQIIPGEIGHYLYTQTAGWTVDTLLLHLDTTLNLDNDVRKTTIYQILKLGGYLAKTFFDLELDLSQLPLLLDQTTLIAHDEVYNLFHVMITEGPETQRWMRCPVEAKVHKNIYGVLFTANNLRDLCDRLQIKLSLRQLRLLLQARYDLGELPRDDVYCINYVRCKGIFIPNNYHEKSRSLSISSLIEVSQE